MSDYISRRAAIDAASHGCGELRGTFGRCEDEINKVPAADVVEVVRCKDCKNSYIWSPYPNELLCEWWEGLTVDPEGYCSNGERRTDGEIY